MQFNQFLFSISQVVMSKEKILVVRKPDRTIHKVPITNKAVLMNYNNRRPLEKQWTFEEMTAEEAEKLPFIDESYVTAADAQEKLKQTEALLTDKDHKIAQLEKMLAENPQADALLSDKDQKIADLEKQLSNKPAPASDATAAELIEKVGKTKTPEDAKAFLIGETRITVINAVIKKLGELEAVQNK